jgi:hypothetical protein
MLASSAVVAVSGLSVVIVLANAAMASFPPNLANLSVNGRDLGINRVNPKQGGFERRQGDGDCVSARMGKLPLGGPLPQCG